jgi:Protein of unknown function (DUF3501)
VVSISPDSLLTLEAYLRQREAFRARVLAHKRDRTVHVGLHVTLIFEDELTVRYQIQEMLRIEKTFDEAGIRSELEAYTPLIPDGTNLKATMMIEYEDSEQRRVELERLKGIERRVYLQVGATRILAIADEDLERENEKKTSAVHFLRFEFDPATLAALRAGAAMGLGIDHERYSERIERLRPEVLASLLRDFA